MSTRAIYNFLEGSCRISSYIHYDGYLEGAAMYFYETLNNPSKGSFATQFIKANKNAELIEFEEFDINEAFSNTFSDIEYFYVYEKGLKCYHRNLAIDARYFKLIWEGSVIDFVNSLTDLIDDFKDFRIVKNEFQEISFLNENLAKKELFKLQDLYKSWYGKYDCSSLKKKAARILEVFPELSNSFTELS